MFTLALLGIISIQLVATYVHNVERRGTVCQLPDGTTRTVGEKFTIGNAHCIKYECLEDGSAPYYFVGCPKINGECVEVNTTYNDGCSIKTCHFTNGRLFFTGSDCSDPEAGVCKAKGETWTVKRVSNANTDYGQCITKQCEADGSTNITNTDCMFQGACFGVGDFAMNKERCEKIECMFDSTEDTFRMIPTTVCRAQNGTHSWCVDVGSEGFPRTINDVQYHDCMCTKNGNGISYQCFSV